MNSLKLHKELVSIIDDLHNLDIDLEITNDRNELRKIMVENITDILSDLYSKSIEENYYWDYCNFLTYADNYEKRLNKHAVSNDEISEKIESLFIEHEINSINRNLERPIMKYFSSNLRNKITIADKKKINYLKTKLNLFESIESQDEFNLDLSYTSATDKVIYLDQLGILDFLRAKSPFNMSINQLATVLSAITGEKTGTLQSMLNPIFSTETNQKNNPLTKFKNLAKIKGALNNIGFESQKTN